MSGELWFSEYSDAVYSYIFMLVKDSHTAEDLTQETFMKVIANEHQFKGDSSVKTWIFRIAYTTTMSYFRKTNPLMYFFDLHSVRTEHGASTEDIVLPERLGVVTQSEHTFLAEWGSDAMDRGEHDFEFHEHGKLVVPTDVGELRRGHVVYYHMPPSVIAKNTAMPEMYIGRVVGLPGETVGIKGGQVFIDDKLLDTFYGKPTRRGMGEEEYFKNTPNNAIVTEQSTREYFNMNVDPVVIKENTVYILVDQWWRGTDSREFGALSIDKIEGIIIGYEK